MFGSLATLVPVALVAFGLLFLGIGVTMLRGGRRRSQDWERVTGPVIGSRLDSIGSSNSQIRCQIAFGYQGRDIFWNRHTPSFAIDPVGREVEVLVSPADPHDAVVAGGLAGPGRTWSGSASSPSAGSPQRSAWRCSPPSHGIGGH